MTLSVLDVIVIGLVVLAAFNLLLQIERWLHQHIFKVGWLITKNFQTTTILYYTFFLPGVVIYELAFWLAAGALDVRAERAVAWPEAQEIGELRLNFVQLSRKASPWKVRLIHFAPLVLGMVLIWIIAISVLDVPAAIEAAESGGFEGFRSAISTLTGQTDFWLWAYFLFTIGNVMLPDAGILKDWWKALMIGAVISIPFFLLGVQEDVIGGFITGPLASLLDVMLAIFAVIIALDAFGVLVLSAIENTVEWITGDSATFKNGKMIVMTREEAIALRQKERETRSKRSRRPQKQALPAGIPSIYKFELPIPAAPGKEPVTAVPGAFIEPGTKPEALPSRPKRDEPSIITAETRRPDLADRVRFGAAARTVDEDETDDKARPQPALPGAFGERRASAPASPEKSGSTEPSETSPTRSFGASPLRPSPSPFGRPGAASPDDDDDADEDEEADSTSRPARAFGGSPLRPAPSPFGRPGAASPDDDEEDDDEEADSASRPARAFGGSSLRPSPSPFGRPGATPTDDDEEDDEDEEADSASRPARVLGASPLRPRPSPFSKAAADEDEDEDDDEIIYEDVDDSV